MAFIAPAVRLFGSPRPHLRTSSQRRPPARARVVHTPTAALTAREVSADELEGLLQGNERPLLIDAFAPWCGPCQFLIPQLDIVAGRYGDKLDIVKLDTEQYPDLASALMVRGLPTLFFVKDGKLQYRMEGALEADELQKLVDYVLFEGPPPVVPEDDVA